MHADPRCTGRSCARTDESAAIITCTPRPCLGARRDTEDHLRHGGWRLPSSKPCPPRALSVAGSTGARGAVGWSSVQVQMPTQTPHPPPLDVGVLLSHLLLLLPPLLPHHDSLPPHPAPLSRSSHALRLLPPLPPYRRLRSLPRNCESACRMPMAHAVLTVFHALWQGIARALL